MKQKNIELWVGFLVVIAILSMVFLCFKVAGERFHQEAGTSSYDLNAYFTNVGNLKVGAAIRSSGVLVGRVAAIQLDTQSFRAKVKLNINNAYHFSQDTIASILTMGILGEQYIGLQQGGDEQTLQPGQVIEVTNSAFILEDMINKVLVNILDKTKN